MAKLSKNTKGDLIKIILRKDNIEKELKSENVRLKEDLGYCQKSRTHYINIIDKTERIKKYLIVGLIFSIIFNLVTLFRMFLPNIFS